jgi:polyhydroxyalkanoate synthesis repressor PhaR
LQQRRRLRGPARAGTVDLGAMAPKPPILIKKYGNRRLYDTGDSRYITLDELSQKIQSGADVRVVDAKSGEDLTQVTLTQIIIEGRGAARLLPVPLLTQLIRLGDDALAEFFGRYVTGALELYLSAKRGAQAVAPFNPFATLPFSATDALARLWMSSPFGAGGQQPSPAPPHGWDAPTPEPAAVPEPAADDVAELRREIEELKRSMRREAEPAPPRKSRRKPRD